jgi:micrococcal nuclease
MGRREKHRVFRPRRRAFLGRQKALLSPGTWAFGFAGVAFGAVVSANWSTTPVSAPAPEPVSALVAPPPVQQPAAPAPAPIPAVAAAPVNASAAIDAATAEVEDPPSTSAEEPSEALAGAVASVVDGDTFYLQGVETRIRLWGVDAPERNAPGAAEATEAFSNLVAGRTLDCEEMDRDRYARIVARCTLDDGRDIARVLIDIGAATEVLRYSGGYYGG